MYLRVFSSLKFNKLDMIPKIIHYIWFGKAKKSKVILDCIASWRIHLPEYEINRMGTQLVSFDSYKIEEKTIELGGFLDLHLSLSNKSLKVDYNISIDIKNEKNEFICHVNSADDLFKLKYTENETVHIKLKNINFAPGSYVISLWVGTNFSENHDFIENCLSFTVLQGLNFIKRPIPYDKRSKVVIQSNWQ